MTMTTEQNNQNIINRLQQENAHLLEVIHQQEARILYLTGQVTGQPYDPAAEYRQVQQQKQAAAQRESAREAERAAAHDAKVQEILKEIPGVVQYCNKLKTAAEQKRDMFLEKAIAFYNMNEQQLRDYTRIEHSIETSAAYHIINQYTEGGGILGGKPAHYVHECDYCKKDMTSLAASEEHCWNNGDSHRDVNLSMIKNEAIKTINAAQQELDTEVDKVIKFKADQEYKKHLQAERNADKKIAKDLPYVTKS